MINIPIPVPVLIGVVVFFIGFCIWVYRTIKSYSITIAQNEITMALQRTMIETQKALINSDNETIEALTKCVQENIKEQYANEEKLKTAKDINEYDTSEETPKEED